MSINFQDLKNQGLSSFTQGLYNSRKIETVTVSSGDSYMFFVDQCPDGGNLAYDINKMVDGQKMPVAVSGYIEDETGETTIPIGLRTLTGGVLKQDKLPYSGLKWIGYKDGKTDNGLLKIYPLIELYSISMSYDKNTNKLDLYFWTNIVIPPPPQNEEDPVILPEYGLEFLAIQKEDGSFYVGSGNQANVRKVMCHARGTFIKGSVNASLYKSTVENYDKVDNVDFIPIFEKPTIVHIFSGNDSKIADFGGSSGSNFPYGDKWTFGLEIVGPTETEVSKVKIWNPFAMRGGVVTSNWFGDLSGLNTLPQKVYLQVSLANEAWEATGNQGRIIVSYKYDMATNTDSLVASSTLSEVCTLPPADGATMVEPLRYWLIPLYMLSTSRNDELSPWATPVLNLDFVHGVVEPSTYG